MTRAVTRAGLGAAVPLAAVLLSGCGADPASDRRAQVAAVTEAANAGDADRLRGEAERLAALVTDQQARQDVPAEQATRLLALADAVRSNADVIDEELLEQRRREAEAEAAAEAERRRLEQERQRLEAERRQLEEDRAKAEQEAEERGKGNKQDKDEDEDD